MRQRAAVALLALVCVAAVAGCGEGGDESTNGASSKANDPFYGVISAEPLPDDTELTKLGDGGVGTLRINLAWGSVQSGPDAPYDWSHYDPVIRGDTAPTGASGSNTPIYRSCLSSTGSSGTSRTRLCSGSRARTRGSTCACFVPSIRP